MRFTDDPVDTTALRAWARALFDNEEDAEDNQPRRNVVPTEGNNPSATASDETRSRDFASRLFGDADATEPRLNED